ncbi:ArsR/SmtB family transcription factor [Salinibaculum rarum]|uniref:ArsR/SmtB family transcription factor n=1 Tax=Salinibaculum rarum TaxID=3058903 RepID=UPI00265EF380|nr:helix-turn-helix domain-containing protein [Salinibaculum sp. KK48]
MSLLPSSPDTTAADDAEPRVVDVDSEDADDLLAALSSETARAVLSALHDEPAPASDLADQVDTSLQNAQYHLGKLESAGAVEVVDTAYSAKGREMDVYAPADQPLVIFAGKEEKESTLKTALSRLLGAVGILAVASLAVQQWFGRQGLFGGRDPTAGAGGETGAGGAGTTPEATSAPQQSPTATPELAGDIGIESINESTSTVSPDTVAPTGTPTPPAETTIGADAVREAGAGLPPGLLFFLGGLFVLAVLVGILYLRR